MSVVTDTLIPSTKGKLMYQIKVFSRKDAKPLDSQEFTSLHEAMNYFNETGIGEGYWTELRKVDTTTVTLVSNA